MQRGSPAHRLRVRLARAGLAVGAVPVAVVLAEVAVFVFFPDADLRAMAPLMYVLDMEQEVHEGDPDPRVVYRLRASSHGSYESPYGPFQVNVNSLGFRGPEVRAQRRDGVFRIICVGGSNVYGGGIDDDETWPARLQQALDGVSPGRAEVINGGVSGYNSLQMVAVSERYIEEYEPDLLIFALSNPAPRFFFADTPHVRRYHRVDPSLWREIMPAELDETDSSGHRAELWLLGHSRLARILLCKAYYRRWGGSAGNAFWAVKQPSYIQATREFLQEAQEAGVGVLVFIGPYAPSMLGGYLFEEHYEGMDVPVFVLNADDRSPEYQDVHPPAHVMGWYASEMVEWMGGHALLPAEFTRARPRTDR